jgi:hypothetical protein
LSDYPVKVTVAMDEGQNRLWGIPILGLALRAIMVIPQAILLWFLAIGVWLMAFVSWIPILLNGRMPGWGYALAGGYIRLSTRCSLYVILMTGKYPPFGITGDHPVTVTFDETERQNQLWGIPLIGLFVRWILLIPHFFVLWILAIAIAFLSLVTWVPVLINGRQADSIVRFFGGFYRWTTRVAAYALLLTGKYPPFSFDD